VSDFVNVIYDDSLMEAGFRRLEYAGGDLSPAMRKIAGALEKVTEDNLEAEGRPKWKPLAESTKHGRLGGSKAYKKNGELSAAAQRRKDAGFRILQHTGQLASSVTTDYDSNQAVVGSNKVYAAIHQFGGEAGRGRKVEITARPYLPITTDGKLQPEAREEVLDIILRHLKTAAGV
jgi:phage virion morphogenesis protein